jgi:hypothetical protein
MKQSSGTHIPAEIGRDALDVELGPTADAAGFRDALVRTRAALGLRPLAAPALIFVPLGIAFGPHGLAIVSLEAFAHLYPVIAIALAALGLFVGLSLKLDRPGDGRLLTFASVEAAITVLVVTGGCLVLLREWNLPLGGPAWTLALVLGICAAATAATVPRASDPASYHAAMRMADLDDVLPMIAGGVVLAVATVDGTRSTVLLLALNVAAPVGIAAAGWLLFERADDAGERGVFLLGVIALLGGTAVYLGVSPLLSGLVAGAAWTHAPGRVDTIIQNDLQRLQHPLVVLLLITAGALAPFAALGAMLAVLYVLTRLCGKLLGGWIVARALPNVSPADLGSHLLSPGVLGLAFALSFHLAVASTWSSAALTAVAIGTLASELLAAFALIGPRRS